MDSITITLEELGWLASQASAHGLHAMEQPRQGLALLALLCSALLRGLDARHCSSLLSPAGCPPCRGLSAYGPDAPLCAHGRQVIALRDSLADRTEASGWAKGAAWTAKQP